MNFYFFRISFWIVVFCGSGTALPTFHVEDLCKSWETAFIDLRHTKSGILTSLSSGIEAKKCAIQLKPEFGSSVVLSLYKYSLEPQEQLMIEDADKFKVSLVGGGDFPDERKSFKSNGVMTLHFTKNRTSYLSNLVKFQFAFTQVHSAPCWRQEFECRNGNCVFENMLCDRHNNCGDNSDEEDCGPRKKGEHELKRGEAIISGSNSNVWIISIVVCGVLLAVVLTVFLIILIRGKRKTEDKEQPRTHAIAPSITAPSMTAPSMTAPSMTAPSITAPSMIARVRQSFKKTHEQEQKPDNYQVPSMYPTIPSAPEFPGVDNPEFKADD